MQLLLILGIAFAAIAIMFALQNSAVVTVTLGLWQFESSLAITLLICLGIGVLITALVTTPSIVGLNWTNSRLQKEVSRQQEQNALLARRVDELQAAPAQPKGDAPQAAAAIADKPYVGLKAIMARGSNDKPS
jgi:putative membrane protein